MNDHRKDALAFLQRNHTGVLASVSRDYKPYASIVHYASDDKFNIFFLTTTDSRKFDALSAHSEVAFVVGTHDVPQTLQIEGRAMDITNSEEAGPKKQELFEVLSTNKFFNPPVSKLDVHETAIIWIEPTWIRWADYAFSEDGTRNVFVDIPIEK